MEERAQTPAQPPAQTCAVSPVTPWQALPLRVTRVWHPCRQLETEGAAHLLGAGVLG